MVWLHKILSVIVLLASVTKCNWGFGGCPALTSIAYESGMSQSRGHVMISIEKPI